MVMSAITLGSLAGAKPRNEEMYFFKLLGSFSEVAVLPPMRNHSTLAFLPLPSATTCSRIKRMVSLVSGDTMPSFTG